MPFPFLLLGALASSVASGIGQLGQSSEEAKQREQEAENRDLQADDILRRAGINADAARLQFNQISGAQQSGYAASGVDVGHGSPLRTLQNTAFAIAHQANTIESEGRTQALMMRRGAEQLRGQAKDIRTAGEISAVGGMALGGIGLGGKLGLFDPKPSDGGVPSLTADPYAVDRTYGLGGFGNVSTGGLA